MYPNPCGSEPARDGGVSGGVVFEGVYIRFFGHGSYGFRPYGGLLGRAPSNQAHCVPDVRPADGTDQNQKPDQQPKRGGLTAVLIPGVRISMWGEPARDGGVSGNTLANGLASSRASPAPTGFVQRRRSTACRKTCGSEPARDGFVSGEVVFQGVQIRFFGDGGYMGSALTAGHLEKRQAPASLTYGGSLMLAIPSLRSCRRARSSSKARSTAKARRPDSRPDFGCTHFNVGASLLAKVINNNACCLAERVCLDVIRRNAARSKLAPTGPRLSDERSKPPFWEN